MTWALILTVSEVIWILAMGTIIVLQRRSAAATMAWLLFLGPFFFITYGLANWSAAQHSFVPSLAFAWERAIPPAAPLYGPRARVPGTAGP